MNVNIPETKLDKKAILVYGLIIGICIISIILIIYAQFFDGKSITKVGNLQGKSEAGYEVLKTKFNDLFTNELQNEEEKYNSKKLDTGKKLVYTGYSKDIVVNKSYNLNVSIPYINIKNDTIDKYNEEIQNTFQTKADEILKTKNRNITYTVKYSAYIQDGVLSIVIKADLQERTNIQRTIIKTYSYSLDNNKEMDLKSLLNIENVKESYVQNKVDEKITVAKKNAEELKENGYTIYERDVNNSKYKIEKINEFYLHNGSIYLIFAYGNDEITSEVDIVVI